MAIALSQDTLPDRLRPMAPWLVIAAAALLAPLLAPSMGWIAKFPTALVVPLGGWINAVMEPITEVLGPLMKAIGWLLEQPMFAIQAVLHWTPWPVSVFLVGLLAYSAAGIRLAALCVPMMLYIAVSGYWDQTMNTLALVGVAVPLSLLIGLAIGIWAQRTETGGRVVPPILDIMQTMPTFAYLIPLLVMFGFGPVVGLIASAIYAAPPMARNVYLGLSRVPHEIVEASTISGSTQYQQLFWVEIPAAMAQIKVGINQTIMAALAMVIIASVIGGFDDIGWEVLSSMRKARFGESVLSGSIIVLLAIVTDRISAAYASRNEPGDSGGILTRRGWLYGLGAAVVVIAAFKIIGIDPSLGSPAWAKSTAIWLNEGLDGFVAANGQLLTDIKNTAFYYYLLPIKIGLNQTILPFTWGFTFTPEMRWGYAIAVAALIAWAFLRRGWRAALGSAVALYLLYYGLTGAPWIVLAAAVTCLAWRVGGRGVALFTGLSLAFILLTGMWERAMLSVYLCGAAAVISFLMGSGIGVWAASSDRVSAIVRPISDTFQTIPQFVYLIPVLMVFQVGEFTALLAIISYAFVPAIRYTEAGLRNVPEPMIEVAVEQGCTPGQIFWQVKLPLAMPSIMVGLNQTIMYAFAMLVIAALVGTTGLGQQIFLALSAADVGMGLIAGFSMALLAMITDRIMQAWSAKQFKGIEES